MGESEAYMDYQVHSVKDPSINKGKRGVRRVVFGRVGILTVCLLIQLLLLFVGMNYLAQYIYLFFGGYLAFGLVILFVILNRTVNPGFQLSWAVIVLLFPVFGGLMYLYIEIQPGTHMLKGVLSNIDRKTSGSLQQDEEVMQELWERNENTARLAGYIWKEEEFPIYRNTEVKYFPGGEQKFQELLVQLKAAQKFIFMEYFIIHPGYMWDSIYEILITKVKEGVEVRVLYDGMNELSNVPSYFQSLLRGDGIQCKVFSPIYPVISTHYNNRDHRKIVVIDGHTAFTGGVNLADEYINRKERFGHWKDAAVMIKGEAVRSFTLMFLKMWNVTGKMENMAIYLQPVGKGTQNWEDSRGFVMPYAANPFKSERTAERIYLDILNHARRYVHIMTPYLVPDYEMLQALTYAAKRGVDVTLILPHIPDKKYAFALAHSYYKYLMQAGVRIYEYTPGFVHSKVFVSDDVRAVVGAINLDYRSLYLNFECAVFLYEVPAIHEIEADFLLTLTKCQYISQFDIRHDKILRRLCGGVLKLVAPLM